MSQIQSQYFTGKFEGKDKIILFYQSWRPVFCEKICVIVHGLGEHSGRYEALVQTLTNQGYGVYAYDHRGHGKSPGQRGYIRTFEDLTDDLGAFLKLVSIHETGKPLYLFGHSLGGLISLRYLTETERHHVMPVGALLSNPTLKVSIEIPAWKEKISEWLACFFPRFTLHNEIDLSGLSHDPQVLEKLKVDPLCHQRISGRFYHEILASIQWVFKEADKIQIPLCFLIGGQDKIAAPQGGEALFQKIKAPKELKIYPDFFHELIHEIGKDMVLKDMVSWLTLHSL